MKEKQQQSVSHLNQAFSNIYKARGTIMQKIYRNSEMWRNLPL
jgi:hypothetical protein